eukprot:CAMPEP_0197076070 /NCGR_PEP_ID=MMETSP1384-20130603/211929_1 /TAXON_ID=29189 /ORGANISM="Ammonia sp." /LENGTH=308 /DNA_ID=CAMNT_0042514919 /DNA_START=874 /DNA_END=1803 /DNA_ORIENTATION=-
MFMRHCLSELNVEGLLFIVEVSQYKAKLVKDTKIAAMLHTERELKVPRRARVSDHGEALLPSLKQLDKQEKKKRREYHFEDSVLSQSWLPITDHFRKIDDAKHEQVTLEMTTKMESTEETKEEDEKTDDAVNMDVQWMYDYARYLFLKYVDVEAEFAVNVSFGIRQNLLLFFSKEMDEAFESVCREAGFCRDEMDEDEYLVFIKDCLLCIFDDAVAETWRLLADDSFLRFRSTAQFKNLCHQHYDSVQPLELDAHGVSVPVKLMHSKSNQLKLQMTSSNPVLEKKESLIRADSLQRARTHSPRSSQYP